MTYEELREIAGADWPQVDRNHRPEIIAFTEAMPAVRALGIRFVGLASGRSIVEMQPAEATTFDGRHVMGGVTGTLADIAAVSALGAARPEGTIASTVRFEVELIGPASGTLIAVGAVPDETASEAEAQVFALRDGEAVLIARCRAKAHLRQPKGTPR